ncbi:MAG TPA: adenylosuccinate synthase, partial [Planctomycetaceae bacterium]|nr:adenylosuccinate synthase [Planctomycetaceae bacterium]
GWKEDITGITDFAALPQNAQQYCRTIEQIIGRPVEFISVGPDRVQTIRLSKAATA